MKLKRILAMALCFAMVFSTMSFNVFAAETTNTINDGGASFSDSNVVYDGTNYYTSLSAALAGIHGKDNAVLYCKTGADLGTMTHGHVCKNLTVYGNGAYISGGEQDFELDYPAASGSSCTGLSGDVTLTVDNLTGAGVWGSKTSAHKINLVFTNCENMGKIYFNGTSGELNLTMTNCTFTGNTVSSCKVYSNTNGTISLTNVDFSGIDQPVALNNKSTGTQTISLTDCDFVNCGAATYDWTVPVSVKSSVDGGNSVLTVNNCSFSGTVANSIGQDADILLDYGVGTTTASISGTAAKVGVEKEANTATYTTVTASETITVTNVESTSSTVTISSLDELVAFRDAVNNGNTYEGQTVTLAGNVDLSTVSDWTPIGNGSRSDSSYTGNAFKGVFDGGNKTISNLTITSGTSSAAIGLFGVVDGGTVKNLTLSDVSINASNNKNAGSAIGLMVNNATADSITVGGSVSAADGVGGVVGRMTISGTISNCTNSANVSGAAAGGIVGKAYYTGTGVEMNITNCTNSGTITGTASGGAGGIVGFSATNVSGCTNSGTITSSAASANLGGIVGWQQMYGEINGNTNNGSVTSDYSVTTAGGIVGWANYQYKTDGTASEYPNCEMISVTGNTNNASIIAANSTLGSGGIVGGAYNAIIVTDNTNYAETITGGSFAAGILGNYQNNDDNGYSGDARILTVENNTTYTKAENITANCVNVVCYDNVFYSERDYTAINTVITESPVAQIGNTKYATLQGAIDAANSGDTITMLADVTLAEEVTLPAGIIFDGNGKKIDNTVDTKVLAGGDLTFEGYTTIGNFNANGKTITIGEGATLETTSGRMVIGHGATFNITGSITDAKTADTANITPSLIIPGASFTGAGVNFNVTNAYVKFTAYCSSKNSNASGTYNINVNNSIWEQTGSLVFSEPTSGMDPTFNFNVKDSVLNSTSHLVFAVTKGEIVIDNSNVNNATARQLENRSNLTIKNSSVVNASVATSSNAKNPGTTIVENATYTATGEFSGSDVGTGTLIVKKGANVTMGKITNANIVVDATDMSAGDTVGLSANLSALTGTISVINNNLDAKIEDGKIVLVAKPVAKIGDVEYTDLQTALKALTSGATLTLLDDVTITEAWDNRNTGAKITVPVTIDGNGKTIKFTEAVADGGNYHSAFRFQADAIVKNLTVDMSEATTTNNRLRAISSSANLTVDGCTFIGNANYTNCRAVIYGEGAGTNVGNLEISITNSTFKDWKRGVVDNENAQDVKTVAVTGNTFTNAGVALSATDSIKFTGNTVTNAYVTITSYTESETLAVVANDNTLTANGEETGTMNYIDVATDNVTAQEDFYIVVEPVNVNAYVAQDTHVSGWTTVWGQLAIKGTESFYVEIYSDDTYLGKTTLVDTDNVLLDGASHEVTWHAFLDGSDSWWNTEWTVEPISNLAPTDVKYYVDGEQIGSGVVKMSSADDLNPVVWAELRGVKTSVNPFKDAPLFLAGLDNETIDGVVYHPVYMATSIDSLNYQKVGFDYIFSILNSETGEYDTVPYTTETNEVYTSISDSTTTYTVDSIGGNGAYLFMNKLLFNAAYYNNDNTKITITPYAYDMDGNKLTGWTFDMTNEYYKLLQSGDVKQDMFKEGN